MVYIGHCKGSEMNETWICWKCRKNWKGKECIQNFDRKTYWKITGWNMKKIIYDIKMAFRRVRVHCEDRAGLGSCSVTVFSSIR